jgi:hypothetical protein
LPVNIKYVLGLNETLAGSVYFAAGLRDRMQNWYLNEVLDG